MKTISKFSSTGRIGNTHTNLLNLYETAVNVANRDLDLFKESACRSFGHGRIIHLKAKPNKSYGLREITLNSP